VIASNVFPYLDNRTDWNDFAVVNKDINKAIKNDKQLEPPGELIKNVNSKSPAFSSDGKFIAHGDEQGNIYLWNRTKGLVAKWLGYNHEDHGDDHHYDEEDSGYEEEEYMRVANVRVDKVIFSPNGNLLASVGTVENIALMRIPRLSRSGTWQTGIVASENGRRSLSIQLPFHQTEQILQLQE
jgi:WD40 repeat protein